MAYAGRDYSVAWNGVALVQSTTFPVMNIIGGTSVRARIFDVTLGSGSTPANNASVYQFQRSTTVGTAGSAFTPVALDPGDPASVSAANLGTFTAGPTLTASAFVLTIALNQQATYRWIAAPGSELVIPATASNGLSLMPTTVTSAFNSTGTVLFAE